MPLDKPIEDYDIIAKRACRRRVVEAGPFNAGDAQARTIQLAHAHAADAWFEERAGSVRLLNS